MTSKKKVAAKKSVNRKPKSTQPQETYVAVVVDRSGSMGGIYEAALSGVNEQVKTLKDNANVAGKTFVSFIQFDDRIDVLFSNKLAEELEEFKNGDFQPRGTTAMYDGVGKAISELSAIKTDVKNVGYLVIVISDGYENASKDYNSLSLAAEITRLQNTGQWTFSYMLANQNLADVSKTLNVPLSNISSFVSSNAGVQTAYGSMSLGSANYMRSRSIGTMAVADFYDSSQQPTVATGSALSGTLICSKTVLI